MMLRPVYITQTPKAFRVSFDYNPKLVAQLKRIPSAPRWDPSEKEWVVMKDDLRYPPGRNAQWYVDAFADWAVRIRLASAKRYKEIETDIDYTLPELLPFTGEHYMLLDPYPYQLEGVRYALDHKRCIFGDQPGLGKMQPYSEPVATPEGFMPMGSLRIGDRIMGRDGNPYTVQEIFEHGVKDVYKITFNDGSWTRAGGEHLWSVRDVNMRKRGQGWKVMTTDQLIERGLTWNPSPSRQASGRKPALRWEVPVCDPVKYGHKDYLIDPYILGVLIGDGFLHNGTSIEFACPDEKADIKERVESLLPEGMTLNFHDCGCPHYRITKKVGDRFNPFISEIRRLELNVVSADKFIPLEYLRGDVEQRTALLQGLMDTDGSCTLERTRITFHTTSENLASDVRSLVLSLGGIAVVREYDRTHECKPVEYQVSMQVRFNPFYTRKKAERYTVKRGNYCSRYISSIEPDGRELSRCILVSAPDHLYLTRDFIVTHNTLQAICAVVKAHREAKVYGESFPVLVVCPASLKINWQREFRKFAGMNSIILDDSNRSTWEQFYNLKLRNGDRMCNVLITNYESLRKFFVQKMTEGRLTQKGITYDPRVALFNTVIIDESHKCKSPKTQQSKFVEGICKGKRFVFELTGTPVVNNNTDLIQQLKILGRLNDFGGYNRFMSRFCDGPSLSSRLRELNYRLWNTCFFRREKQKVLSQLPEKSRQYITCDITNRKEYNDAERDVIKYLREYKNADDDKVQRAMRGAIMVKMGILKSIAAKGKIKAVSEFVHDIIDGEQGEKLILFAYLKEVVTALKKEFPQAVTVTGDDSIQQKQEAVDRFQGDERCRLIILNYKSGGTGLTLTASSRVAFIEFPWTYSDCEQAEDRAHRNGQKNNVNCYYFLGDKTIDRYMYDVIQTKKGIADGVTGTETQVEEDMVNITMNLFKDRL